MTTRSLPTSKLENWKYSPVRLLPDDFSEVSTTSEFVTKPREKTQLVTRHEGSASFGSTVLNISVAQDSTLQHWYLFDEGTQATHIDKITVTIARGATYTMNALTIASLWSRCDLHIRLEGEGAECHLIGLDLARGNAHVDRHLFIEHLVPHTKSTQLFKGVFDGDASASFFGLIRVYKGADGTSAHQVDRNLLLSPNATVNSRPQLEIDTDDVSCTHGATVGQLDENAIFFLRSRGLSEEVARALLTEGFTHEILEALSPGKERDEFENKVLKWLGREQR